MKHLTVILTVVVFMCPVTLTAETERLPETYADFFAWASVHLLAKQLSPGETFNHSARDSTDISDHLTWAKNQSLEVVRADLIDKFGKMVEIKSGTSRRALATWYADTCVKLARFGVDFGSRTAESTDPSVHFDWAASPSTTEQDVKEALRDRVERIFARYEKKGNAVVKAGVIPQFQDTNRADRPSIQAGRQFLQVEIKNPYSGTFELSQEEINFVIPKEIASFSDPSDMAVSALYAYLSVEFIAKKIYPQKSGDKSIDSADRHHHLVFARSHNLYALSEELGRKFAWMIDHLDRKGRRDLAKWYADFCVWFSDSFFDQVPLHRRTPSISTDWSTHSNWVMDSRTTIEDIKVEVFNRLIYILKKFAVWDCLGGTARGIFSKK